MRDADDAELTRLTGQLARELATMATEAGPIPGTVLAAALDGQDGDARIDVMIDFAMTSLGVDVETATEVVERMGRALLFAAEASDEIDRLLEP
jgi:hypothetical protein